MPITIFSIELSVNGTPVKRAAVGEAIDRAAAKRAVEAIVAKYASAGFNEEHGYWWGRDAAGSTHRFVIEDSQPDTVGKGNLDGVPGLNGPAATVDRIRFAEPTINDFIDQIRSKLDDAADRFSRSVRSIENRESRRGISGNLIEAVIDEGLQSFEQGAIGVFRDLRRAAATTKLDHKTLRDLTVQELQNFLARIKAIIDADQLKRIAGGNAGAIQEIDRRIGNFDHRMRLMIRQMDVGLLNLGDEVPAAGARPASEGPPMVAAGYGTGAYGTGPYGRTPAPSDAGGFQAGTFDTGTFDTATFAAASTLQADATVIPGAQALHREMLTRVAVLEEMIGALSAQPGGIGHNNPPEPIEGISFGDEDSLSIVLTGPH